MRNVLWVLAGLIVIAIAVTLMLPFALDSRESIRKQNRDYKFVDIAIGCECGNKLNAEAPVSDKDWPLVYYCGQCSEMYTVTKGEVTK